MPIKITLKYFSKTVGYIHTFRIN